MAADIHDAGQAFIAGLEKKLQDQEAAVAQTKKLINALLVELGQQARYADLDQPSTVPLGPMRGDEYYGKSMSTAAREVLERRAAVNAGPATLNEIHSAMKAGGYQFGAKNEEIERQSLRNLLVKNSGIFHKLPNGKYGLLSWYPNVKEKKPAPPTQSGSATTSTVDDDEGGGDQDSGDGSIETQEQEKKET